MARLAGKVAFITGAARGQGRSHAVRLAEEGADIIAVDIGSPIDLGQTVKEVEALDRRIVANAGIVSFGTAEELTEQAWQNVIDVDLTGVWLTVKAAIPHLRAAGGGSIVIINSGAGLKGSPNTGHYAAAKHGLVGLMQSLANELAPDMVRVNSVHPGAVDNDMLHNQALYHLLLPDHPGDITREEIEPVFQRLNALPIPCCSSVPTTPVTSPAPAFPSTPGNSSSDIPPAPTHTRKETSVNASKNSNVSSQTRRKQKTSIKGVPDPSLTIRPIPIERLDLSSKRLAVVGGTNGLGRAIAQQALARGAEVTVVGRTFRDAPAARLTFVAADLSSMREAARLGLELPAESFDLVLFTTGIIAAKTDRKSTRLNSSHANISYAV